MTVWKNFYLNRKMFRTFIVSVVCLIFALVIYSRFLLFVDSRPGVSFEDPILVLFSPVNLTWLIFAVLYLSIIAAIINFLFKPTQLTIAVSAYFILIILRICAMYLLPLEPPKFMIALNDPVVEIFGTGKLLTKDLFFSGHTSMMFLFFLATKNRALKLLFLIGALIVACSVLLQHVHYSVDVFIAPFFAYVSYKISNLVILKI